MIFILPSPLPSETSGVCPGPVGQAELRGFKAVLSDQVATSHVWLFRQIKSVQSSRCRNRFQGLRVCSEWSVWLVVTGLGRADVPMAKKIPTDGAVKGLEPGG